MKVISAHARRFAKVLIFGPAGQGKTYFLGTAQLDPRTAPMLLLDFEGGYETLSGLPLDIVEIRTWEDYNEVYEILESGEHWKLEGSTLEEGDTYKSIGIDSVSETHTFALLDILDKVGSSRRDPEALEIQDYGKATVQLRRLLRAFRDLPLHVFYTAHAKEVEERGIGKVKVPAMAGAMAEEVVGLMSIVGYLAIGEDDEGETFRELILQNFPKFRTKARVPWASTVPDTIEDASVTSLLDALEFPGGDPHEDLPEEDDDESEASGASEEPEDNDTPKEEDDEEVPPYIEWSVADLRSELRSRDLPTSGNRQTLAERLDENDEQD